MESLIERLSATVTLLLGTLQDNPSTVGLLGLVLVATVIDIALHRIPNVLTVGGVLLGLILQSWLQGWSGLLDGLGGVATGFFMYLPLYAFGWMGAGDVKLMAAVGSFLGWPDSLLAVALGTGIGSELRRPLGIAMVGGLLLSQALTLYTTPVIYIFFDNLAQRFARKPHPSEPGSEPQAGSQPQPAGPA